MLEGVSSILLTLEGKGSTERLFQSCDDLYSTVSSSVILPNVSERQRVWVKLSAWGSPGVRCGTANVVQEQRTRGLGALIVVVKNVCSGLPCSLASNVVRSQCTHSHPDGTAHDTPRLHGLASAPGLQPAQHAPVQSRSRHQARETRMPWRNGQPTTPRLLPA